MRCPTVLTPLSLSQSVTSSSLLPVNTPVWSKRQHVSAAVSPCCFIGQSSFMVRFLSKRLSEGGERRERDLLRQVRRQGRVTDAGEDHEKDGGGRGRRGVKTRTTARFRWERKKQIMNQKRPNWKLIRCLFIQTEYEENISKEHSFKWRARDQRVEETRLLSVHMNSDADKRQKWCSDVHVLNRQNPLWSQTGETFCRPNASNQWSIRLTVNQRSVIKQLCCTCCEKWTETTK